MGFFEQQSRGNGVGVFLTPDACVAFDKSIDRAINLAFERGIEAGKALYQQSQIKPLKSQYTYKEIREEFCLSKNTICNWAKKGIIHTEGVGNKRYVSGDSIQTIKDRINKRKQSKV